MKSLYIFPIQAIMKLTLASNSMATLTLYFLLLFALPISLEADPSIASEFIKASCRSTRYPALCVQSLSAYADSIRQSERQLAQTALAVSLHRARSTAAFVSKLIRVKNIKPRELSAVKDCIETMSESVDRLGQSVRELRHMGGGVRQEFMWHMSNVQTWVSAALTDENTCLDGFAGGLMEGKVKGAIKRRVTNIAQITSNALALVNHFAERHRPAAAIQNP